jgi:hypothetical protein
MAAVNPLLKQLTRTRVCALCGSALQLTLQKKYDPFWIVLLIFAGAVLAFYLLGIAIMVAGLSLLSKEKSIWVCPVCSEKEQHTTA